MSFTRRWLVVVGILVCVTACENTGEISAEAALRHASVLAETAVSDVNEVRTGLPLGAEHVAKLWHADADPSQDLEGVLSGLRDARNRSQDLRVAKSTFFAVTDASGTVLRSDQDSDLIGGKAVFQAFPALRGALTGSYTESTGALKELNGVRDKADGQWIAAEPVTVAGAVKGLYVTGWAWSSYAYRLEFKIRGIARAEATKDNPHGKDPLVYVYIVAGGQVYGAPVSPDVNASALRDLDLPSKTKNGAKARQALEITGREFGVGAVQVPALGPDVVIAVLRSET